MFVRVTTVLLICVTASTRGDYGNQSSIAYDAGELLSKIFSGNSTQPRKFIKFEEPFDSNYISFVDQKAVLPHEPVNFEFGQETNNLNSNFNNDDIANGATDVKFDDPGKEVAEDASNYSLSSVHKPTNGKTKRRRRKQRQQLPGQSGYWNTGYPGTIKSGSGPGQSFGQVSALGQSLGSGPGYEPNLVSNHFHPRFNGQSHRPSRRPQPSLASDALAAVTGALTSVAHNDDYQCVARLLCEAAAGGALGGSSLLESVSGLQPLLTLLSAYNGISSNPLFVFGRAAFLGMSSKGQPGSCRYAYPLCPTDPERLVHYLNNHNGGFFKFFNAPQHGQHNLEQFYNQLSQNYGIYQPTPGTSPEFYGLLNPEIYQNPSGQQILYPNSYDYQQNYGFAFPHNQYNNNGNGIRFRNDHRFNADGNKIEKRIQNRPVIFFNDYSVINNSKWLFPGEHDDDSDESKLRIQYVNENDFGLNDNRNDKVLKFPDADSSYNIDNLQEYHKKHFYNTETIRKSKAISFPESQSNRNDYNANNYYTSSYSNKNNLINNERKGAHDIHKGVAYNYNHYKDYQEEAGVRTVYVVRGNGDPSKPEIIKLRPGEKLY